MILDRLINKKGITLIEVIIVLAISTLVLMTTFSMFSFGNNVFRLGNEQYDIQSDVRIASDYIQNQVRYATSLQLVTELPPENRGTFDENDNASDIFGLEYIVLENDRLVHYVFGDEVDVDGNLEDDNARTIKYSSSFTLPGTSFDSSSANELIFVVNASDRPGNYTLRSLIALPNFSIYDGMHIEKYGDVLDPAIGIRFTRSARELAGLSGGGSEITDPAFVPSEVVAVGNNNNQKEKRVRIVFSNSISNVVIANPLRFEIKDAVAVEIYHNTNNDLPSSFSFQVTDIHSNTLELTVTRDGINYEIASIIEV